MDIRDMQTILMVVEEGSLTKAAEKLFLTQPALSRIVSRVESELGAKIFNKFVTPWQLTHAGEIFLKNANKIISIFNLTNREIESLVELKSGRLTIAVTPFTERYLLPTVIPFFKVMYPNFDIRFLQVPTVETDSVICHNVVNFGVVALPPACCEDVEMVNIKTYNVLLAMPLDYPLAKGYKFPKDGQNFPEIDLKEITTEPLILIKDGMRISDKVRDIFKHAKLKPNIAFEVSTLDIAYHFVEAGNGLSFLFDEQINREADKNKIAYFKIKGHDLSGSVSFCYRRSRTLNKVEKEFLEILQEKS